MYVVILVSTHFCQSLMKLEFSQQIFEIFSNIKFHENLSSGSGVVSCGRAGRQTDRHEEPNSRFSRFR